MLNWTHALKSPWTRRRSEPRRCRLSLEALEARWLLSGNNFLQTKQTNLVSDLPGVAQNMDSQLVNPWASPKAPPARSGSRTTTPGCPRCTTARAPSRAWSWASQPRSDRTGSSGTPTGTVFNGDAGAFNLSPSMPSHAIFLFATEDGTIVGWNPGVNPKGFDPNKAGTYGILAVDNSGNNFTNPDPAQQFVDVYNLDGSPGLDGGTKVRLISRGPLDSPWGLAIAPAGFGSLGGDLLVGNFGNGRINAFDATHGTFVAGLKDPDGEPIQVDGLWALQVGNGKAGGDANTVYFTAGLAGERHGLFGSLAPVAAGTPEGQAEQQAVTAALDVFQLDLATLQQDLASKAPQATIIQDIQTLQTDLRDLVRSELGFVRDTRSDLGIHGHHSGGDFSALDTALAELGTIKFDLD